MKILFVGSTSPGQTSEMRMRVLEKLGHDVASIDSATRWMQVTGTSRRLQQAVCAGPVISRFNDEVIQAARAFKPELMWAEKQEYLTADTLEGLKKIGARLLHFTPDPYFTLTWKQTRLTTQAMPLYDYLVTSKRYELSQYSSLPARIIYMPLGFSEEVHRPLSPLDSTLSRNFASDVSFLGGWEPRRETMLDHVAEDNSLQLKVWGYGWDHLEDGKISPRRYLAMRRNAGGAPFSVKKNERLASTVQGNEVYAEEYAYALSGARISLGFLRKVCPDQHTTRTFEIPACASLLLADRTDEHQEFFEEGAEADFFGSSDEMLEKLRFYLRNEAARADVARRGFERCHRSGYSYTARVSEVMKELGA